ncbi:MAG: PspA/IM30 family protein [Candidatus Binatia bacterium]
MASIFKRINDIITANINDLIDRVEDPERMIKQLIREMEENVSRAKEGVIEAIASEKRLYKDLEHHQRLAEEWQYKATQALQADNEDLARAALVRKKEYDRIVTSLEPSWEAAKATSERLKRQLQALEAKLEEARRKRSTLVARQRAAQARVHMDKTLTAFEAGLDAQANFARMEDKVTDMEARVEAMAEVNSAADRLEKEFQELATEKEVEDELAALRKKIKGEAIP